MKTPLRLLFVVMVMMAIVANARAAIGEDSSTPKIVVTKALFGSGLKVADVTRRVADLLHSEPNGFSARGDWLGDDPVPYKGKALVIAYDYKGKHYMSVTVSTQKVSYQLLIDNAKMSDGPHPPADL